MTQVKEVAMVLQTMDIIKTMTRSMDRHYILKMVPGSDEYETFDRQTAIIIDKPTLEETVMVDTKNGPTPAMQRKGMCIGVERGKEGSLVVFTYDEVVDKSNGFVYQRDANCEVVNAVEALKYMTGYEFVSAASDILGKRMNRLRQTADEINGKWLVLQHIKRGSVRDQFVTEAGHVISGKA